MGLLYDIRMKPVEQPLERTDLNVFRGQRYGSTLSELRHLSDSINDRLQTIKTEFSQGNQTSQDSAGMKFLTDLEEKKRMKTQFEEWKMTAFPFFLALSFFIGMFIGIINRDVRNPFFLALALFATIFPVMYFVLFFLEGLAKNQTLSPFLAEIIFLSLLSLTAFFLYRYATSPKRRWRIAS